MIDIGVEEFIYGNNFEDYENSFDDCVSYVKFIGSKAFDDYFEISISCFDDDDSLDIFCNPACGYSKFMIRLIKELFPNIKMSIESNV